MLIIGDKRKIFLIYLKIINNFNEAYKIKYKILL